MFYDDLKRGKKGESYVKELMAGRNHKVEDVSMDFAIGYDFLIDDKKCELKTDKVINRSGNLFLEDYMEYSKGGCAKGWLKTSKAEYLFYLDEQSYNLYIYLLDELRDYLKENWVPMRSVDDGYKRVYGYCLDKNAVRHQTIERCVA